MGVQWGGLELTVASSSITTVTVHCGTSVQYHWYCTSVLHIWCIAHGTTRNDNRSGGIGIWNGGMCELKAELELTDERLNHPHYQPNPGEPQPPSCSALSLSLWCAQRVMLDCISGLHSLACSSLPPGIPEQPPRPKIKTGCQFGSAKATQLKYGALLVPRLKKSTFK